MVLGYGSSRNWSSSLSPHFCLLSFTKIPNYFFCHPSSDHQRNLSNPHYITSLLCSGPSDGFHPTTAHCPLLRDQLPPVRCSLSSDILVFLPFLQTARSAPSLGPPASDPLPQVTPWLPPSCHSEPMRHQILREAARMSHLLLKNRSPIKAGPCSLAAQAPTRFRHIET